MFSIAREGFFVTLSPLTAIKTFAKRKDNGTGFDSGIAVLFLEFAV